ncbi:MAG: hypothetical protein ABI207_06530 [Crocinitomicaceae bacterium]
MNSLLKLEVFKSLKFETKEAGMRFIKENKKLSICIQEEIDNLDEVKYNCIENIKVLFDEEPIAGKLSKFLMKEKMERQYRIENKKVMQREILKESLREEIMNEMKISQYSDVYPNFKEISIGDIKSKFNEIVDQKLNEKQRKKLMKAKDEMEKAIMIMEHVNEMLCEIY